MSAPVVFFSFKNSLLDSQGGYTATLAGNCVNDENGLDHQSVGYAVTNVNLQTLLGGDNSYSVSARLSNAGHYAFTNDAGGYDDSILFGLNPEGEHLGRFGVTQQHGGDSTRYKVTDDADYDATAETVYTYVWDKDALTQSLYRDGTLVSSESGRPSFAHSSQDIYIGARTTGVSSSAFGTTRDVYIFDYALNATDVQGINYLEPGEMYDGPFVFIDYTTTPLSIEVVPTPASATVSYEVNSSGTVVSAGTGTVTITVSPEDSVEVTCSADGYKDGSKTIVVPQLSPESMSEQKSGVATVNGSIHLGSFSGEMVGLIFDNDLDSTFATGERILFSPGQVVEYVSKGETLSVRGGYRQTQFLMSDTMANSDTVSLSLPEESITLTSNGNDSEFVVGTAVLSSTAPVSTGAYVLSVSNT